MGLFKKKQKRYIVDFRGMDSVKRTRRIPGTESPKQESRWERGYLKINGESTETTPYYNSDSSTSGQVIATSDNVASDSNAFGFLGDLAGAAQSGETETQQNTEYSNSGYSSSNYENSNSGYSSNPYSSYGNSGDINDRLEMINRQIYKLTQQIELLELKINKLERKGYY
jgi:hypothetical protein